jgi:hypothetical protein
MQHDNIPCEHFGTLSPDGSLKVSDDSTILLVNNPQHHRTE